MKLQITLVYFKHNIAIRFLNVWLAIETLTAMGKEPPSLAAICKCGLFSPHHSSHRNINGSVRRKDNIFYHILLVLYIDFSLLVCFYV